MLVWMVVIERALVGHPAGVTMPQLLSSSRDTCVRTSWLKSVGTQAPGGRLLEGVAGDVDWGVVAWGGCCRGGVAARCVMYSIPSNWARAWSCWGGWGPPLARTGHA